MDGETRFSVFDIFHHVVKSNAYYHKDGRFMTDYWTDNQRSNRPMFQLLKKHIGDYDGRFDKEKVH